MSTLNFAKFSLYKEINIDEIYKFLCIHFLYYDSKIDNDWECFFKSYNLKYNPNSNEKQKIIDYKDFLDKLTPEKHKELLAIVPKYLEDLDNYRQNIFYKQKIFYKI